MFQEISIEMDVKTVRVIVKNKSTTIFLSLYSYRPIERMSECSKLCIDLANKLSPLLHPVFVFGGGGGGGGSRFVFGFLGYVLHVNMFSGPSYFRNPF